MPDLKRLQATKTAYRQQAEKLITKTKTLMTSGAEAEDATDLLTAAIENLQSKLKLLGNLDEKIQEQTSLNELGAAIIEADDYAAGIQEHLTICQQFIARKKAAENGMNASLNSSSTTEPHKRRLNLPKLSIPTFDGTINQWPTFFDAFTSAIDNDTQLDDVQKFQYLQAQLQDEAKRTIEGLTLTSGNYADALELLKKRYGQTHKLVAAYMKGLWELPPPSKELSSLRNFYDKMESHIRGLRTLGKSESSYGDFLVPIVLEKLPGSVRTQIARDHGDTAWTLSQLRQAILDEIEATQAGKGIYTKEEEKEEEEESLHATAAFLTRSNKHVRNNQEKYITTKPTCAFCKDKSHKSMDCEIIQSPEKRLQIVKRDHLCFNCLREHKVNDCKSKFRCRNCKRKHHTALCNPNYKEGSQRQEPRQDTRNQNPSRETPPKPATQTQVTYTNTGCKTFNNVALKTAKTYATTGTSRVNVNILLDEGAQRSFVTQGVAERLELSSNCNEAETISLATFGSQASDRQTLGVASFKLETVIGPDIQIRALVVPEISATMKNFVDKNTLNLPYLKDLTIARQPDQETFDIDILIGADYYWDFVGDNIVRGEGPTAVSSKLGYLLSGPIHNSLRPNNANNVLLLLTNPNQEEHDLQKYWDLESIGIKDDPRSIPRSDFQTYKNTHLEKENGRYIAKLPWKADHPPLPTNREVAATRTRNMVQRLEPTLRDTYNAIIEEQLEKGFVERVPNDDGSGHYIPHHAVKKESSTTPIRIVYDCSCKIRENPSLNDCLEKGQPLLNDMVSMLIRFRTNNIGLSSDLEKAFLNVRLHDDDRKYTKFFWLSDSNDPGSDFKVFQFTSVLFGAVCSPFILNAVVKTQLEEKGDEISTDLKDNIYVDNILTGVETTEDAIHYYNEANATMASCCFKLRSWATNDEQVAAMASRDNVNEQNETVKLLGLNWNTKDDTMGFTQVEQRNTTTTKREVVRLTSSIYDPLGLLAPVQVSAKIFIQELWQSGVGWDSPLSEELTIRWNTISEELREATSTIIDRRYFTNSDKTGDYYLETFCDSSMSAYGAMTYIRHNKQTALVMAKTRVRPLSKGDITLPRLELMSILLGTRLTRFIEQSLETRLKITKSIIWSDKPDCNSLDQRRQNATPLRTQQGTRN